MEDDLGERLLLYPDALSDCGEGSSMNVSFYDISHTIPTLLYHVLHKKEQK